MGVPKFLKDKWLYISLLAIILLIITGLELTFHYLDSFTRHGEEMEVPNLIGQNFNEVVEDYSEILTFQVIDSVYVKNFPEGAVYQQDPKPGLKMKKGRNMYIIRTSIAPEIVKMPNLRNLSLRQSLVLLNSVGLKVEKLVFVDYFARNAVVNQRVNNEIIEPGTELVKGSGVILEVGLGKGDATTHLPDLIGTAYADVKGLINNASLNLGAETFIDNDSIENMFVYRIDPEYDIKTIVQLGSDVNVWYKSVKTFDFQSYKYEKYRRDSIVDRLRRKNIPADSINYVIDSFNYILSHRTFSYDPVKRSEDMQMRYVPYDADFDSLYFNDNELDTNYIYYE